VGNRIYVGNISWSTTEEELRNFCAGSSRNVTNAFIATDRETGKSRGFAFVSFDSADAAEEAIAELDGAELGGRTLKVNQAHDRERNGGGGNNHRRSRRYDD
jgi:RNA recognition motif-containing protein